MSMLIYIKTIPHYLAARTRGLTFQELKEQVAGRDSTVRRALAMLEEQGRVRAVPRRNERGRYAIYWQALP